MRFLTLLAVAVGASSSDAVEKKKHRTYHTSDCKEHFVDGEGPTQPDGSTFLCRMKGKQAFYATSFDTEVHCPIWSAYKITFEHEDNTQGGRRGFKYDPDVDHDQQTKSKAPAYKKEHRDIGHLAPSSTFSWDKSDGGAWEQTYWLTNVAPQGSWFNEHPWAQLEKHMRDYVLDTKADLYVVTGTIQHKPHAILDEGDAVPDFYYKVWCDKERGASAGILGNNDNECHDECGTDTLVSVASIEKKAGIDLFPSSLCKTNKAAHGWGFDEAVYKYAAEEDAEDAEAAAPVVV